MLILDEQGRKSIAEIRQLRGYERKLSALISSVINCETVVVPTLLPGADDGECSLAIKQVSGEIFGLKLGRYESALLNLRAGLALGPKGKLSEAGWTLLQPSRFIWKQKRRLACLGPTQMIYVDFMVPQLPSSGSTLRGDAKHGN